MLLVGRHVELIDVLHWIQKHVAVFGAQKQFLFG